MKIRMLREKQKITQAQLAEELGVNQKAVSQWECGTAMPSADKLPAIAAALSCTINDLFGMDWTTNDRKETK